MQKTLISHIYNEEYLLPFWIEHYKKYNFDNVVIIDYDSTDNSIDIIKDMAPDWQIRASKNKMFEAAAVDREVMEIESEFTGWKMTMNTTEFAIFPMELIEFLEDHKHNKLILQAINIVSPADTFPKNYFEFINGNVELLGVKAPHYDRLIHKNINGQYRVGRHLLEEQRKKCRTIKMTPFSYLFSARIYPWNKNLLSRKLQIKNKIPISDKEKGRGFQHQRDAKQMEDDMLSNLKRSKLLRDLF